MIKSDRKLKELENRLKAGKDSAVAEAIGWLRNEEPFSGAIGMLVALFDASENADIRNSISGFMNDLKELSARPEVMEEIKKPYKDDTVRMLASSCWQSGLDYSRYASDFAILFKRGDYLTALECFTVLEESSHQMSGKARAEIIALLGENEDDPVEGKKTLRLELVKIFS